MSFLSERYDPALEVKSNEKRDDIIAQETERLIRQALMSQTAGGIPRRLGEDVDSSMLALDKKRCKRIYHVCIQCLMYWGPKGKAPHLPQPDAEIVRQAAQVSWPQWWEEHSVWLENRMLYVVTWGYKTGEEQRWLKSALVRLSNERRFLEYAMRE